jgi:Chaperone of endosialidase
MTLPHKATTIAVMAAALIFATRAEAITLPDTGSCNSGTDCLAITNTNSGGGCTAIFGNNTGQFGYGVRGNSTSGQGVYGTTTGGYGVWGDSSSTGTGVYGTSSTGTGVIGTSTAANSTNPGVYGSSTLGKGVYGTTGGGSSVAGVWGSSSNSGGTGVRAITIGTGSGSGVWASGPSGGYGVFGEAGGTGFGVYGVNQTGGWAGYFQGNVFSTGTYQGSDIRLKKDVVDLRYGSVELLKLHPVAYKWKNNSGDGLQLGLIAQDVQSVIPEVVRADARSGMLSVAYTELVPVMIKTIQQQELIIRQQDERIAALERATPQASAIVPNAGAVLALGLLPIGLFVARRRRQESPRSQ